MVKKVIKLRMIFMGTSAFASVILENLIENKFNLISVYTQPDKKVGRQQKISKSAVKKIAEKNKLKIFEPKSFNEESIAELKEQKPDIIIVAAYGKILPIEVLEIPGFNCLNVHASLLPKFRGPSPIQNAILEGEKETGATIIVMDKGIDTGAILTQKKITISSEDNYLTITKKLATISAQLLVITIPLWVERRIQSQEQEEKKSTYCQLIEKEDGHIFWNEEASLIYNKFKALIFWPGIFSYLEKNGYNLRLKLIKISLGQEKLIKEYQTGEVFKLNEKIAVYASGGYIILEEVQLEGKNTITINEFINGCPDFVGSILK